MNYTFSQIATALKGEINQQFAPNMVIEHILFDSRKVIFPTTAIFFAIIGKRQNGHHFVSDAFAKGVRHFVVNQDEEIELPDLAKVNVLKVRNTTTALQKLALFHRHQFNFPVIGITGSNGKTVVKEWLFQLLHANYQVVRSPKSYNSQIGVPLSVLRIQPQHNLGIFEAGISQVGEMKNIAPIITPTIGVFTNIGAAHSEGFDNQRQKIREKLQLFKKCETLVYCVDHKEIAQEVAQVSDTSKVSDTFSTFTWSKSQSADFQIISIRKFRNYKTEIVAKLNNVSIKLDDSFNPPSNLDLIQIEIPFVDDASIENAIHCWCVLLLLNIPPEGIAQKMWQLEPVAMRLELRAGVNNCTIVNDSYNSDLHSLEIALNFLQQQSQHEKNTLILSDILQSGAAKEKLYAQVQRLISNKNIQRFIGVGEEVNTLQKLISQSVEQAYFSTITDLLAAYKNDEISFQNETILLKGARQFTFEKIAHQLAQRIHQTVLEVNLDALVHNLSVFHQYLKPSTKVMAMVKASAYGSGSIEVARLLEFQNVDYLAVAYADEGVELRRAGIQLPILVLNPEAATYDALFEFDLEPEVYHLTALRELIKLANLKKEHLQIHLKIDTGMHRLGFEEKDVNAILRLLNQQHFLTVASIFSHLAASEAAEHDEFTQQQIRIYQTVYRQLSEGLRYQPIRHILNSSGIVRFADQQMDMVRLGIGLYGIDGSAEIQQQLRVVNSLKATISQIKNVAIGETIGYSRRGLAERPLRTATISIGYADGLPRAAGNGRYSVLIKNQLAPIIGNVCMDMCMVDVTDLENVEEGDTVIIFGEHPKVDDLAKAIGTISYEVFTNISQRVKRIYIQE
ncbi:MAG: bifunctional UDP-N-acetylmuramoyl-tripeptide:D-alanyl-D-alanine ligase/alanine racemase [Saprospiraceae bacterium]